MRMVELGRCKPDERRALLTRSEIRVSSVVPSVMKIVEEVRRRGDAALLEFTSKFDGVSMRRDQIRVSEREINEAVSALPRRTLRALGSLARSIREFHRRQLPRSWFVEISEGVRAGQVVRPIESAGVYVPGGEASYPSTLLMAAVPAKIAGVSRVIVCTPPKRDGTVNPAVLAAAKIAGVDSVFRVGGAQAIAAMAYGTESIPRVEKIVGPGNIYVTAAKRLLSSVVEMDFEAGPSEILIVADESANPKHIAADLISQAEHDVEAACVLVTPSKELALAVKREIETLLPLIPRSKIASASLSKNGLIVLTENLHEAIDFANEYAPEHFQLVVRNPRKYLRLVKNAGAVFMGYLTPVALGDLAAGPNHILPTGGRARVRSGLSVLDFLKMPTVLEVGRKGLLRLSSTVRELSKIEGLEAHSLSVSVRLQRGREYGDRDSE